MTLNLIKILSKLMIDNRNAFLLRSQLMKDTFLKTSSHYIR